MILSKKKIRIHEKINLIRQFYEVVVILSVLFVIFTKKKNRENIEKCREIKGTKKDDFKNSISRKNV